MNVISCITQSRTFHDNAHSILIVDICKSKISGSFLCENVLITNCVFFQLDKTYTGLQTLGAETVSDSSGCSSCLQFLF